MVNMATLFRRLKNFLLSTKDSLVHLNLFDSDRCRSDAFYLRSAILASRINLILLITIVTILAVTSTWGSTIETLTERKPNETTYEMLYEKYSRTLSCRCKHTAITYGQFISVSTKYHPICSSVFVSDRWIKLLFNEDIGYYIHTDFRSLASGHFQLLSSLCSLAKQTVNDALNDFLTSTFISANVLSSESLKIRSQEQSNLVRRSSADTVRRLVNLIRDTTHANYLQTALQTPESFYIYIYDHKDVLLGSENFYVYWLDGKSCTCSQVRCKAPAGFYDLYKNNTEKIHVTVESLLANVTGLMAGCYAIDALLESTLECFFDRNCLNTILNFYRTHNTSGINILSIYQTKFSSKTLIETLLAEAFIEQWTTDNSFSAYYNECEPISCTFTGIQRSNLLYVLATLIGLCGGFTVIFRICLPPMIHFCRKRFSRSSTNNSQNMQPPIWRRIHDKIIQLNIYNHHRRNEDPYDIKTEFISTRIYLIVLGLTIIAFIIFLSVPAKRHDIIVENPSIETFQELYHNYSTQLHCPCHKILVNYGSFLSISPQFHPVCSSAYLSYEWIASLPGLSNPDFIPYLNNDDFHIVGELFFLTISTLCSMAQSKFSDSYLIFNYSTLVTDYVMSSDEFISRIDDILNQFQSNNINEFKQLFSLIRFHSKNMLTSRRSNADLWTNQIIDDKNNETIYFHGVTRRYGYGNMCLCAIDDECRQQAAMYSNGNRDKYEKQFEFSNIYTGCFAIQSVLQSSFECFFNQTCLNAVQTEIFSNESINISILQRNATRFPPETLFITLMNSLMIEDWGRNIQYNQYYKECAPRFCSYPTFLKRNPYFVFTKIIGSIGGLIVGLKIIVRIIVKQIRKWLRSIMERNTSIVRPLLRDRFRQKWHRLKIRALELNIFTKEITVNAYLRYTGILATRLYFLLLILSVTVLIIYTSAEKQKQYITEHELSKDRIEILHSNPRYASTLVCPCRQISIPYRTFVSLSPRFHQLCSSDLMKNSYYWLNIVCHPTISLYRPYHDFRLFVLPEFEYLLSLCPLADQILSDALTQFMSTTFTSIHLVSRETFEKHVNESISRFRSLTPRTFVRMLDYILQVAQGNCIVSSILSNWHFFSSNQPKHGDIAWSKPRSYDNCSCGINSRCTAPAFIDDWRVPGFLVGCYPLEALLQSTLECLYDPVCIKTLENIHYKTASIIRPLNSTYSDPHVTVQSLVDELMVDHWETNISYDEYYEACEPLLCSYSLYERTNILYTISSIIGLFGGLSVILRIIAPLIFKIGQYVVRYRRQRRVQPAVSVVQCRNN